MRKNLEKSKVDFIFSGLGAAVGLGNVLRFPGACANYGGAFLIVTFFAMLLLAFPMLLAEVGLGRKREGGAVYALNLSTFGRNLGWSQCLSSMLTALLYVALAGWIIAMAVTFFSFEGSARSLGGAFFGEVLSGQFSWGVYGAMLCGLVLFCLCLLGGVALIAKTAKVAVVVAVVILSVLAVKGFFLCGGAGVAEVFRVEASDFLSSEMWLAALGQVFFSLSVAVGVMPRFGANLSNKRDIFPSCLIIVISDYLVSVLAAAALNLNLHALNLQSLVTKSGILTAFSVYPVALKYLFGGNALMCNVTAGIFYLSLIMLAVQAAASFAEAFLSPLIKRFNLKRRRCVLVVFFAGAILVSIFASGIARSALEISDLFLNFYGVLILAFLESVYFLRWREEAFSSFDRLYMRGNRGARLFFLATIVSALLLFALFIKELLRIVSGGLDYSTLGVILLGVLPILAIYATSFLLTNLKVRK